ncbi:aspartic peptidase domain-containing protein [Stachybotrys elegans]|uniref:Aspartic peptidase domain-containing protein n=1 Tax=Stachybotrys elegans TaxID=80388 RepID=A0A8K0WLY5_9HYPO|nr:aspartic peptidase domain-containing protein [Stachybotrys elegans]
MGLSQLFLLSLVASSQALVPARSLPVVDDNVEIMGALPVAKAKRSLPVVDDNVEMMGSLPAIAKSKRTLPIVDDNIEWMGSLPVANKRKLPESGPSGLLSLPVIHVERPIMDRRSLPELDKRVVELQLENRSDVAYYAPLNIGTPAQEVYVQIDTGSYELWVNPDCSVLTRESDIIFCGGVGRYNPASSSTANETGDSSSLRYGIGSANFDYYTDSISISGGDGTVQGVKFGVASSSTDQAAGILGLGFGERNVGYNTLIDELADQEVIATKAFSVGLGSKAEGGGVIVFGGVDTAKFEGGLARLPIIPADQSPDNQARYWVQLESIALNQVSGRNVDIPGSRIPVFLDTGATLSLLPPPIADSIAAGFGANGLDSSGFYTVDCRHIDQDGTVDFEFDGMTVRVSSRDFIRQISVRPPRCYLGVVPRTDFTLLGASFLRSAYGMSHSP